MIERNANGEWEINAPDRYEQEKQIAKAWIQECEGGHEFGERYNFPENVAKIMQQMEFHGYDVCFTNLEHVFLTLRDSGALVTSPTATPAAAGDVPRAANGQPLTGSQLEWRNFAIWANDPKTSSREIAEKRRTSPSFNKFYIESLKRQMNENPIDGDARPNNPHLVHQEDARGEDLQAIAATASMLPHQLVAFVKEYNATPSARVRALRSPASNPLGFKSYCAAIDAAIAAGLL